MRWRSTAVHSSGVGASSSTQPPPFLATALLPKGRPSQSCGAVMRAVQFQSVRGSTEERCTSRQLWKPAWTLPLQICSSSSVLGHAQQADVKQGERGGRHHECTECSMSGLPLALCGKVPYRLL